MPLFGPIDNEAFIFTELTKAGARCSLSDLRQLAHYAEIIRKRNENECSYEWANTERYQRETELQTRNLGEMVTHLGLHFFMQTDCRGALLYVDTQPIAENVYNRAYCLTPKE